MKKITLLLSSLLIVVLVVNAQTYQWQEITPFKKTKTYEDLYDVCFIDNQHGWAVGVNGVCIRTSDGQNWENVETPIEKDLWSVFFIDKNIGWASGVDGTIIKTNDGGNSWIKQIVDTTEIITRLFFTNDSVGWAVGTHGTCLKTTDGGENWLPLNVNFTHTLRGIYFFDENNGWICGLHSLLKKTNDGGNTWQNVSNVSTASFYNDIYFYNKKYGYIVASGGTLISTTDGGNTWSSAGEYSDIGGISVACSDSQKVFTVGIFADFFETPDFDIVYSADGGNTFEWKSVTSKKKPVFYSIQFVDTLNGWAVGEEGAVFRTIDGGVTWNNSIHGFEWENIIKLYFTDNNNGWAATSTGYVLKTTDGGFNWEAINIGADFLMDFQVIDDKHFWASGPADTIYYSNNLGNTWQKQATGIIATGNWWDGAVTDLKMVDSIHGFAEAPWGDLLTTNNGGKDWILHNKKDIGWPSGDFYFCNKDIGWAIGQGGSVHGKYTNDTIYKTTDGGNTWIDVKFNQGYFSDEMVFTDSLNGWFFTNSKNEDVYDFEIAHTSNGGETWELQNNNFSYFHHELSFSNKNHGWAIDINSLIYTFNGGETWQKDTLPGNIDYTHAFFLNQQTGWLASKHGGIFKTNTCFANATDILILGDTILCSGNDSLAFSLKTKHKIYVGGESPEGPFGDYFYPNQLEIRSGDTIDFEWVGTKNYNLKFTDFEKFNVPEKAGSPNMHQIVVLANSNISFFSEVQDETMTGEIISKYKAAYDDFILVNNKTSEVVYFGNQPILSGNSPEGVYTVYNVNHDGFYSLSTGDPFQKSAETGCFEIGPGKELLIKSCVPYLSRLEVDGSTITGFNSDIFNYTILLPNDTVALPTISATPVDANAKVVIKQIPELPGIATVTVIAEDGVTSQVYTINFTVEKIVNSQLVHQNNIVKLFPNPASRKFKVESSKLKVNDAIIEIYNLTGRKLLEKQIPAGTENVEIDVSHLKSGIYFCKLSTKKESVTKKLVIQK